MSIALDLALYIREQKLDKPLTTSERGVLFTLFFRVGSNPFTWISQKQLAIELDIIERNVRKLMSSIKTKGFIEISSDPKDKRKNLYRPSEFLINYHQQAKRVQTKEYRSKSTYTFENTGQNRPVNTGQNRPVLSCAQSSEKPVTYTLQENVISPKAKVLNNTISKAPHIYCAQAQVEKTKSAPKEAHSILFRRFYEDIYPLKKNKERAWKIWNLKKYDEIATFIFEDIEKRKKLDVQWQDKTYIPHPATYLKGKLWQDELLTEQKKFKKSTFEENKAPRSTVKEWLPGNSDYDRVNGINIT